MLRFCALQRLRFEFSSCCTLRMLQFFLVALCSRCTISQAETKTPPDISDSFAALIDKAVKYFYKVLRLRCSRVLTTLLPFPCGTLSRLQFFHVALFDIAKYRKWTEDRRTQKRTLHSTPWTCFTFILISYNTFLLLHSFEWLIKWKGTNLLFCWKRICLPKLETFKTRMWIEVYFSPT